MYIPKRYGESKSSECPFCGKQAITKNPQGVPTCLQHKEKYMDGLKCVCGDWLDVRSGKWGPYFTCMKCGNINWNRGLEMNPKFARDEEKRSEENKSEEKKVKEKRSTKPQNITITENDVEFFSYV